MYYVYLLESEKDGRYYIGHSQDINDRLNYHNTGRSEYTKHRGPWKMLAYKKFETRSQAMKEELRLKKLRNRERIRAKFGLEE